MGTIIGDFFKKVGGGIGKVFDGDILDGLGDVLGGVGDAAGRTVNGALNLVGLGDKDIEPGTRLILCEIALLAKMSKVDGRVDKSEIDFVNALFDDLDLSDDARKTLQSFFNEQKKNLYDYADWAQGVLQAAIDMNPDDESCGVDIRLQVYRHLFLMALADGELDDAEIGLLRALPDPLGFKPEVFDMVAAELLGEGESSTKDTCLAEAYATLGVSSDASDAEVKKAWKRKMATFHPDRIQGKDLAPEWVELANEKSSKINQAFEIIQSARNKSEPSRKRASSSAFQLTQEALLLFAALAAVDGSPNATERRFIETHFGFDPWNHPSWNRGNHSSMETLAADAADSYGRNPKTLETLSRLLHDFVACDQFVSNEETSALSWIDYIFKKRSSPSSESSFKKTFETPVADDSSIIYLCPTCGIRFSIPDGSDEYMVACPKCGKQLDLTELEPET